jgi:FkbM family methyltransferase
MSQKNPGFDQKILSAGKNLKEFLRQPRKVIKAYFNSQSPAPENRGGEVRSDIFSRLPVTYHATALGNFYVPAHARKDIVANEIRAGRVFEPHVLEVAKSYAKKGTAILDIGANFGQMSVLFSQLVGETGKVFSFEAQEYCFAILEKNIAANNCKNIQAFYGAVMEKGGGEVFFPEPDLVRFQTYGAYPLSLTSDKDSRSAVKTLAIDDLTFDLPISFCKVDTQGSDIFVMRGMRETIRKHQMPILFEYEERFQEEFGTCFQDYVDFVRSIDYRFAKTIADINYLILPAHPPKE